MKSKSIINTLILVLVLLSQLNASNANSQADINKSVEYTIKVYPQEIHVAPDGNPYALNVFAFLNDGKVASDVPIVFSTSNAAIKLSQTAAITDNTGLVTIEATTSRGGWVCGQMPQLSAPIQRCPNPNETTSDNNAFIDVAAPTILTFSPIIYLWTGNSSHEMSIYGANFNQNIAVLVADNPAKVLNVTDNIIEIEFPDPFVFGVAQFTYVEVINLSSQQQTKKSGVSFQLSKKEQVGLDIVDP